MVSPTKCMFILEAVLLRGMFSFIYNWYRNWNGPQSLNSFIRMAFPPLPVSEQALHWPSPIIIAAGQIYNAYSSTTRLIESGNYNSHRIAAHKNVLYTQTKPLIASIKAQEPGLEGWVSDVCEIILNLHEELLNAEANAGLVSHYLLLVRLF